jgi:hypothetical protein
MTVERVSQSRPTPRLRPLLLAIAPGGLGFDQALEPVGERAAVFLRKPLSRRFYGGGSMSGAKGVRSAGGIVSSIWDLKSAAFSTSAAAIVGFWVDLANLRRVAA